MSATGFDKLSYPLATRFLGSILILNDGENLYHFVPGVASNVLCRLLLVLEIEPLTETILVTSCADEGEVCPWCASGGHVACAMEMRDKATLDTLFKDSLGVGLLTVPYCDIGYDQRC